MRGAPTSTSWLNNKKDTTNNDDNDDNTNIIR